MGNIAPRIDNDIISTQITETSADEKTKIATIFADIVQRIKDANS
jgi:hypothetical protein